MSEINQNKPETQNTPETKSLKRVQLGRQNKDQNKSEGEESKDAPKSHSTTYFGPDGQERTFIQAREKRLALDRNVGQRKVVISTSIQFQIITDSSKESEAGGYWCDVCKCSLKDNRAWLDHINGRKRFQCID